MVRRQPAQAVHRRAVPSPQQQGRPGAAEDAVERQNGRQRLDARAVQAADKGGQALAHRQRVQGVGGCRDGRDRQQVAPTPAR